jgi:heme A synthase
MRMLSSLTLFTFIGAVNKPLFIGLGTTISVFYVSTLSIDYLLRRKKKLQPMVRRKAEKPIALLSILFSVVAAVGLICLTIFDAFNHSTMHWTFAAIFFVGLAISGALNVTEIGLLHKDHPKSNQLRWSFRAKLIIIILAVISLILMAVLMGVSNKPRHVVVGAQRIFTDNGLFCHFRYAPNHPTNTTPKAK